MMRREIARLSVACLSLGTMVGAGSSARAQQKKADPAPAPPTAAQTKPSEPALPAWRVQCEGAGQTMDCRLSQTLFVQQSGQRLLAVVVRSLSKTEPAALMFNLPHGLFLPAGVTMQFDKGKSETLPVQTCDAQGCYAGTQVTAEMQAAFEKSQQLLVVFQDLKKQPISIPVALAGFAEAYAKLP